jgi:hypothetical protein
MNFITSDIAGRLGVDGDHADQATTAPAPFTAAQAGDESTNGPVNDRATELVELDGTTFELRFAGIVPWTAQRDADLQRSLEEEGRIIVPVLCWKRHSRPGFEVVIDGAGRVRVAAHLGLKVPLAFADPETDDEAAELCRLLNYDRGHLAAEVLAVRRQERISRVAEMRRAGMSTRAIAGQEAISQEQVRRDLKASTDTGVSVEPPDGKVTGEDGKKRDASKPSTPAEIPISDVKCARCKRLRLNNPNCEHCDGARIREQQARDRQERKRKREAKGAKPSSGRRRAGGRVHVSVVYDWKTWAKTLGATVRAVDAIGRAYKQLECPEHKKAVALLDELWKVVEGWKGRLGK